MHTSYSRIYAYHKRNTHTATGIQVHHIYIRTPQQVYTHITTWIHAHHNRYTRTPQQVYTRTTTWIHAHHNRYTRTPQQVYTRTTSWIHAHYITYTRTPHHVNTYITIGIHVHHNTIGIHANLELNRYANKVHWNVLSLIPKNWIFESKIIYDIGKSNIF